MRYALTVFGNKNTSVVLIERLIASGATVDLVVTLKPEATTAIISGYADVSAFCAARGIAYYGAESYSLRSAADRDFFASNEFDLGLCTGWQRLIPDAILNRFEAGIFGWHGSFLRFPNGRGRSPLNWSIRLGGDVVHHNAFRYAPGVDDGPIFETRSIPIDDDDYIADLQAKALAHIADSAVRILAAQVRGLLSAGLIAQPLGASILFPKLTEADGEIFPDRMTAGQIRDLVRSCSRPFPGAFLASGLRVWRCDTAPPTPDVPPGHLTNQGDVIRLRALDGDAILTEWEYLPD